VEDAVDLGAGERHGLVVGADEAGDAGRVLHDRPGVVGELHLDQDVAREHAALLGDLLAVLRLDDLLGRHDDLDDALLLLHRLASVLEIGLDLVLVPRISIDDVPLEHARLR
jgi:hypothetical protein